jgi:hypothetical protein
MYPPSVERACVALMRIFNSASTSGGTVGVCPELARLRPVLPAAGMGVEAAAAEALPAASKLNAEVLIL